MKKKMPNKAAHAAHCVGWTHFVRPWRRRYRALNMHLLLALLIAFPLSLVADDKIKWDKASELKIDVNCDGAPDTTILGYKATDVVVKTTIANSKIESTLEFGIGQSSRQDALCGTKVSLTSYEGSEENYIEMFGEVPEGFKNSPTCHSLNIAAGECDSIHIIWNHKINQLNWWRL